MEETNYKDVTTSRGIKYHYYFAPPTDEKPFLLFIHGFPSTSYDWRRQIEFFGAQGYGLVVPDMLGYGGTLAPVDPLAYRSTLITKDLIDILDVENVQRAVVIGHDWGSKITSRLANYYPERFTAYAFLDVAYMAPSPVKQDFDAFHAMTTKLAGADVFGYWDFFSQPGVETIIEEHLESFVSLAFTDDPADVAEYFAPKGALKAWLLENKFVKTASFIPHAELQKQTELLRKTGFGGSVLYYKIMTSGIDYDDNLGIPANLETNKPVFFAAALKDAILRAHLQKASMESVGFKNLTIKDYACGHWIMLEVHEELNQDLLEWIQAL